MAAAAVARRTWPHGDRTAWRPLGVYRLEKCGCWIDGYTGKLWEPCMAHEGEGHLSVISPGQDGGLVVARCLVRTCRWQETWAHENWAVEAAQRHWADTRETAQSG